MAKQVTNIITGRVENLVFQHFNGVPGVRTLGDTSKRSKGSEQSSNSFIIGQKAGAAIRSGLMLFKPFNSKSIQSGFSGAIKKWVDSTGNDGLVNPQTALPYLQGFNFNPVTGIAGRWKPAPFVSHPAADLLQLHIPAFVPVQAVAAPANTMQLQCNVTACGCLLDNYEPLGAYRMAFTIPYNKEGIGEQLQPLPLPTPARALLVTLMRLQYLMADGSETTNRAFMPASVIDARFV